jgi:hypothetical protein
VFEVDISPPIISPLMPLLGMILPVSIRSG